MRKESIINTQTLHSKTEKNNWEKVGQLNTTFGLLVIAGGVIASSALALGYGAFNVAEGEGLKAWGRRKRLRRRR